MARPKKKSVLGVELTSPDGVIWNWQIGKQEYQWCAMGWLLCRAPSGDLQRMAFSTKLEGAVGYTAGWHDGFSVGCTGRKVVGGADAM